MNTSKAIAELADIRNEAARGFAAGVDYDALRARCDAVGQWLAKQKTTRRVMSLLHEAHETFMGINKREG